MIILFKDHTYTFFIPFSGDILVTFKYLCESKPNSSATQHQFHGPAFVMADLSTDVYGSMLKTLQIHAHNPMNPCT